MKAGVIQLGLFNLVIYVIIIFAIIKLIKYFIRYNADYKLEQQNKEKQQGE